MKQIEPALYPPVATAGGSAVTAPAPTPASPAASSAPTASAPAPAAPSASSPAASAATAFKPPPENKIPEGPMGDVIRKGEQIFLHTGANAKQFVGNSLNCVNCHLDAGRQPDSAPLWGAYTQYPAYRNKTKSVDTFSERLRGCFMYSMNGKAPEHGDDVLVALEAYAYWLAKGAPVGEKTSGAGYPKLEKAAQKPDFDRGHKVFEAKCALCHGADGQGQKSGDAQVFPPLWGPKSYNWGAGMTDIDKAAGFIKANMPLGLGNSLSDQEAWDVAAYIDSQDRPQDPRFTGNVADTRKKFHDSEFSMYGIEVKGRLLGQGPGSAAR
ncbi:c-type cytochrome [Diaphorobacter aerolatus]|uniref:C-type cytochrome n=2 Tax=Diaphorobacter aerolatus TaxID=1288495 RepID=A0A7H0GQ05_9BURK|nr:c-type cytochrome [Diaphorobacter aerolatus]